jgi:methionyl-tRNA formyltransferase
LAPQQTQEHFEDAVQSGAEYRVVFFGSTGVLSYAALAELLKRKVNVVNIVAPGTAPDNLSKDSLTRIPLIQTPKHDTIELLALEHGIPVTYVQQLDKLDAFTHIQEYAPDFIFIACFPFILPKALWQLPKIACVNLHPSLLPTYRGPQPLFWQLKKAEPHTGVTLHLVNDVIDGGDIILQKEVALKPGMRDRAINNLLGQYGGRLFAEAIRLYHAKRVKPRKQGAMLATYMSAPKDEDFELSTHWTAQHAFNFMRGTEDFGKPYFVQVGDRRLRLDSAIAYSPVGALQDAYRIEDHYVTLRFAHGVLQTYSKNPDDGD